MAKIDDIAQAIADTHYGTGKGNPDVYMQEAKAFLAAFEVMTGTAKPVEPDTADLATAAATKSAKKLKGTKAAQTDLEDDSE